MREGNYESSDQGSQVGTAVTFLLIGLGIGAAAALLLAPKTGKQFRKDIRRTQAGRIPVVGSSGGCPVILVSPGGGATGLGGGTPRLCRNCGLSKARKRSYSS